MSSKAGAIRAGRAYVEAFLDATQLEKSLGKIKDRLKTFSRQIGAIGGVMAGMGTAVIAPMAAAVKVFADAGDKLHKMSQRTGVSVETLSALDYAATQSGTSIEGLEKAMAGMARFALQVSQGSGEAAKDIEALGLSVNDLQSGTAEERFLKLARAIRGIEDPVERAGMSMRVFGKSGRDMLPLIAGDMDALMARAKELGITMSQEDADAAAQLTDALDELYRSVGSVGKTIATALIPKAVEFSKWLQGAIPEVRAWLAENNEMVVTVAKLGATLMATGTGILALAAALNAASTVAGAASVAAKLLNGNLLTLGKTAGAAFAVAGILMFAKAVYDANKDVQALNKSLQESARLDNVLADRRSGQHTATLDKANQMEGAERQAFLDDELKRAQRELEGMNASLAGQKKLVEELEPTWKGMWQSGRGEWQVEKQELDTINSQIQQQRKFVEQLRAAKRAQQAESEEFAARDEEEVRGINSILDRLNEQLETFGMDAGEKAVRELEKLNANEEELAEARQKLADLADKEATAAAQKAAEDEQRRAEEEAAAASESIANMLQALADEVSDLKLPEAEREMEKRLRELSRLGANEEQLAAAKALLDEKSAMSGKGTTVTDSPSSQGGTFSALAGLMFSDSSKDVTKGDQEIIKAVKASSTDIVAAVEEGLILA